MITTALTLKKTPYAHQVVGIEALVKKDEPESGRVIPGVFALFDEMGAGKTKQVIDAMQLLYERGEIDNVIVLVPAAARDVWYDPEIGELKKHLSDDVSCVISEYHARTRTWKHGPPSKKPLRWTITNYEFIRNGSRLMGLLPAATFRTYLVCDESSAVKNHRAQQTKAVNQLRKRVGRVVLLNGTPIANNPLDMFAQGMIMHPDILGCKNFTHFRAEYVVMGQERGFPRILGWRNLEDLQRRFKPYVLRRLKKDCLDLPPKLDPVTLTARLTPESWAIYKEMRDELIAWLDQQTVSVAVQAGTKVLRLAQIAAGFAGGLEDAKWEQEADAEQSDRPVWVPTLLDAPVPSAPRLKGPVGSSDGPFAPVRWTGREKLDTILEWIEQRFGDEPNEKILLWCRFRPELWRLHHELKERWPNADHGMLWGAQKRSERAETLRLLKPGFAPAGPVVVCGTTQTGSMAYDFAASHYVMYVSNGTSLFHRKQSEDRVHRPGQTHAHGVWYGDVVAVGPNGQKTVDHTLVKALRDKDDLATWTCSAWIRALEEE